MNMSHLIKRISLDLAWVYVKSHDAAPKGQSIIMGPRGGYKYNAIRGTKRSRNKLDKNIGKYDDGIAPNTFIRTSDGFDYHVKSGLYGAGKFTIDEMEDGSCDVSFSPPEGMSKTILRGITDREAQSAIKQMSQMKTTDPSQIIRNNKTGEIYITGKGAGSPVLDHKKFPFGDDYDPEKSEDAWYEGNDYQNALTRKYPFATVTYIE